MRLRPGARGGIVFSAITGLFFYGFWGFLAWGGLLFFSNPDQAVYFVPVLSSGLMFVMLYWQLAPIISASFGASLDLKKLLVYPIPHRKLFTVEILLRITTCAEMLIVLAGAVIGLMRNPLYGAKSAPVVIAGALAFAALNILLSAGARSWLERVFLRTKLKEVLMFLVVIAGLAPRFLLYMHVPKTVLLKFAPTQLILPWAAVAHVMLNQSAALAAGLCACWIAAAWAFSRWQFERSIRYDTASVHRAQKAARADGLVETLFRLPSRFMPDPIAAIMEKELRTLTRIPRFRLVFAMSCFFGFAMFFPLMQKKGHHPILEFALPLMALYGLLMLGQISYWNSLGFDRSAVQGYFSWPIQFRDVLIAKNLTVVCILIPQILVVSIIGNAIKLPAGPGKILETIVVMIVACLYWFAMGNIFSVRMPRALDPERSSQMSRQTQALTIWTAPFLLLPLVLAYWARWFFESEIVFAGLVLFAAIIGGIFYWVGLDSAVKTAGERREIILTKLSRSDGPLSIT